ncbi:MAG: flagellar protein FliT [Methylococcaceae bacterium]
MGTFPELLQQLEGFVSLIAVGIEDQDWEGLDELLVIRQEALVRLCALSWSPLEREAAVAMMTEMQTTDRQFEAEVKSQKAALQKQATSLFHDRKAIQAYQSE